MKIHPRMARLLVPGLCLASFGCAAPKLLMRGLDQQQKSISHGLVDSVDAIDKVFGEHHVEDALRKVEAKVSVRDEWRENHGNSIDFPIRLRVPFPALERWANIFIQFDTTTENSGQSSQIVDRLDDNKAFTLGWLSRIMDAVDSGVRVNLYWSEGSPQTSIVPFGRWKYLRDPYRAALEQTVYYKTDNDFGGRSSFSADYLLGEWSYLRLAGSAEYYQRLHGANTNLALIYRSPLIKDIYFSAEAGVSYNPYMGPTDKEADVDPLLTPEEQDEDQGYVTLRAIGPLGRPWIEWEVRPSVYYPWNHEDTFEWGVMSLVSFRYEAFLSQD